MYRCGIRSRISRYMKKKKKGSRERCVHHVRVCDGAGDELSCSLAEPLSGRMGVNSAGREWGAGRGEASGLGLAFHCQPLALPEFSLFAALPIYKPTSSTNNTKQQNVI